MAVKETEIGSALAGFGVAAVLPAVVMGLVWPLSGAHDLRSIAGTMIVALPFSIMAVLLFGVPAFFLLRRFRPGRWWAAALVGLVLGIFVACALRLPNFPDPQMFLTMGPLGALSAVVFWSIWRLGLRD